MKKTEIEKIDLPWGEPAGLAERREPDECLMTRVKALARYEVFLASTAKGADKDRVLN